MQKAGGCMGDGGVRPLLLDLPALRARHSVGPELAFPAGSTVSRGRAKGGCDPTPAAERSGRGGT